MGTTLHNKIQLGRPALLAARPVQAVLMLGALGALTGVGIVWAALRGLK